MSSSFDFVAGWRCPLCMTTSWDLVVVKRSSGASYATQFYQCSGCTVMFRDRGRFTRLGRTIRRWAGDIDPVSIAQIHDVRPVRRSIWIRRR